MKLITSGCVLIDFQKEKTGEIMNELGSFQRLQFKHADFHICSTHVFDFEVLEEGLDCEIMIHDWMVSFGKDVLGEIVEEIQVMRRNI